MLTFVCPLELVGSFQWTIPEFLVGSDGLVTVGVMGALNMKTTGNFTLTAEGTHTNTRSTVICGSIIDSARDLSGTVTVLGKFVV